MGDFSVACSVSGLPIGDGKLRFLLLCTSPYDEAGHAKPGLLFFPRTVPFSAEYTGYGTVCNYDEATPQVASILPVFATDLVEVGVGENQCHDSPTDKNMSFIDLLDALRENRVRVRETDTVSTDSIQRIDRDKILPYPTLAAVRSVLKKNGIDTNFDNPPYYVDELCEGWVRIRAAGFGEVREEQLQPLLPFLNHWRAIITSSIGGCGTAEIQIMPNPKKARGFIFRPMNQDVRPNLPVRQAFIHEEVWQHFAKSSTSRKQFDTFMREYQDELYRPSLQHLSPPFCKGQTEHLNWVYENKDKFSNEDITSFIKDMATTVAITRHLYTVSSRWEPSMIPCGPQYPDHGPYVKWHKLLLNISKRRLKEEQIEEGD